MKFGRKSRSEAPAAPAEETTTAVEPGTGPFDIADVDVEGDGVERVDLGGLLIAPAPGLELRLQVDQQTQDVQSVVVAGPDGGVELRAFSAARSGDSWHEIRRQIAAETSRRGGTATEQEGRFGTELLCDMTVQIADGRVGRQTSRVVGVNGPRWFLRATYLGRPAVDPAAAGAYEDVVANVVVRRGAGAMPPGDPIPLVLPPQARRVQ